MKFKSDSQRAAVMASLRHKYMQNAISEYFPYQGKVKNTVERERLMKVGMTTMNRAVTERMKGESDMWSQMTFNWGYKTHRNAKYGRKEAGIVKEARGE